MDKILDTEIVTPSHDAFEIRGVDEEVLMIRWLIVAMVMIRVWDYVYITVPENAEEPWKLRLTETMTYLSGDLAYLTEYFGYDSKKVLGKILWGAPWIINLFYPAPNDVTHEIVQFEGMLVDMYRPADVLTSLPAVLVFGNGGWMMGGLGTGRNECTRIASLAKVVVYCFSTYRHTPDHVFPAALEDCHAVARHLMMHATENNVIPGEIAVLGTGEGAGGNLAMAVALKLSKDKLMEGISPLKFVALYNPCLQSLDFGLKSYQQYDIGSHSFTTGSKTTLLFFLSLYGFGDFRYIHVFKDNSHTTVATKHKYKKYVNSSLLDENHRSKQIQKMENFVIDSKIRKVILDPYFSPLMASDDEFRGLPNIYLTLSEYTVLRDEGMIFAERMKRLNHTIEYNFMEGRSSLILRNVHFKTSFEEYKRLAIYMNKTFKRDEFEKL